MPTPDPAALTKILAWLAEQRPAMIALLAELVNIDSGSYDKAGVDQVGARLRQFFAENGIPTRTEDHATFGAAIFAEVGASGAGNRPIVLMGHRDTVFAKGEVAKRPFHIEGGRAYGPGVADMKAGLVMNAFVLAAFHKFGGAPAPLLVLITSDEEIASPSSRPVIERVARGARAVLNSEPSRPNGSVVTGRKGGCFLALEVTGKAAHSGGSYKDGISAIVELAHKTIALQALTDLAAGVTVNVGIVKGGQSVNTIAPHAEAEVDLRYIRPEQRTEMLAKIAAIVETATVPGTKSRCRIKGEFLALVETDASRALFAAYQAAAVAQGASVVGEFSGGCADSGFTSQAGAPTLCGLGPVGGKGHTEDEFMELDSLVARAQVMVRMVVGL